MRSAILLSSVSFLLAACSGQNSDVAAKTAQCEGDGISVSDAWMRPARAGQPTSAAYVTLCNGAKTDDALVSASFAGADATEIHITSMSADNMAMMAPAKDIPVSAGGTATLEPGGAHIMLIGVKDAVQPGDHPVVTLTFENAPPMDVAFEVRNETPEDSAQH